MPATADTFANFVITQVGGGALGVGSALAAADTTMYVGGGDGAKCPPVGPFRLLIGSVAGQYEIAQAATRTGDQLTGLTRSLENTNAPVSWPAGTQVEVVLTAAQMANIWAAINRGRAYIPEDYGAIPDGATDCTTAVQAAINAANSAGGGQVHLSTGTYVVGTLTMFSNVHLVGVGFATSTLKLKAGTNADLINGGATNLGFINVAAANGVSNTGGLVNWSIRDLTLDGNKAGQSSGTSYCLRTYGFDFILGNLRLKNGRSGGLLSDWNGGGTAPGDGDMEAQVYNVKAINCGGIGIQWGGPHDSEFTNVESINSGSHGFHIAPNATGLQFANCHAWGEQQGVGAVAWLIEAGYGQYVDCASEGSDSVQTVILAGENAFSGCHWFGAGIFSVSGIQIGQQAGQTPIPGQVLQGAGVTLAANVSANRIDGYASRCEGANGVIRFANDGGNFITLSSFQTAGALYTGTLNPNTELWLRMGGMAGDHTRAKNGGMQIGANSQQALTVTDGAALDIFNVNAFNKQLQTLSGADWRAYSDQYTTLVFHANTDGQGTLGWHGDDTTLSRQAAGLLQSNGSFALRAGSTQTPANNATLIIFDTAMIGEVRLTPAGAVTGLIIPVGTISGQMLTVVNESAFSVTFAAAATSHVVDGVSDVIAATSARMYVWDGNTSFWYPCK